MTFQLLSLWISTWVGTENTFWKSKSAAFKCQRFNFAVWESNGQKNKVIHLFLSFFYCTIRPLVAPPNSRSSPWKCTCASISWSPLEELSGYIDFNTTAMWLWILPDSTGDEQQTGRLAQSIVNTRFSYCREKNVWDNKYVLLLWLSFWDTWRLMLTIFR